MDQIITSFFLKNKYCPFPGVGCLSLTDVSAQLKIEDRQILAPKQLVNFTETETDAARFIECIARKSKLNKEMAAEQLSRFCTQLKNLEDAKSLLIEGLGIFYKNNLGQLQFKQQEIDDAFSPIVNANRVIHASDSHPVLVGDKTVSSDEISNEESVEVSKPKRKIWIWVLVLTVLLVAAAFTTLWFAEEVEQATGIQIPFRIR